jgi:NhaP-type Na+/H+ or K+/H+ antiporter
MVLQIMILAWPGVVVSFLLIGVCAYFFFPYGWTWTQCLLFGAVHSATDPVAVLAGLHQVGWRLSVGPYAGRPGACTRKVALQHRCQPC